MTFSKSVLVFGAAIMVSGCDTAPEIFASTRNDTSFLTTSFADATVTEQKVTREAIRLEDMVRDLTKITKQGGAPSAIATGCSGRDISDPEMSKCSESQLKGRWIGHLNNLNPKGKPVEVAGIIPTLAQVHTQLGEVDYGISELLDAQATERDLLLAQRNSGEITERVFNARMTTMMQNRESVADTLALSATQASKARRHLEKATSNGQLGLDWYVLSVAHIEDFSRKSIARLSAFK